MSVLVAYNYTASEALEQGVAIAFDAVTTEFNERKVHKASDTETIVGVAAQTVSAGQSVSVISFVVGQSFKVKVGENISRGNAIGMRHGGDNGVFYKHDGYGLLAMDDCSAGDLVEAVCVKECAGAVEGDLSVYGDLELANESLIAWDDQEISAPNISGPLGVDVGGVSIVDNKSVYPVGAITFARCTVSGFIKAGSVWAASYFKADFFAVQSTDSKSVYANLAAGASEALTGTWKVLSNARGDSGTYNGFCLIQRIL